VEWIRTRFDTLPAKQRLHGRKEVLLGTRKLTQDILSRQPAESVGNNAPVPQLTPPVQTVYGIGYIY
jgi:hypothetical protein